MVDGKAGLLKVISFPNLEFLIHEGSDEGSLRGIGWDRLYLLGVSGGAFHLSTLHKGFSLNKKGHFVLAYSSYLERETVPGERSSALFPHSSFKFTVAS